MELTRSQTTISWEEHVLMRPEGVVNAEECGAALLLVADWVSFDIVFPEIIALCVRVSGAQTWRIFERNSGRVRKANRSSSQSASCPRLMMSSIAARVRSS
jgi:hypothetical protein